MAENVTCSNVAKMHLTASNRKDLSNQNDSTIWNKASILAKTAVEIQAILNLKSDQV